MKKYMKSFKEFLNENMNSNNNNFEEFFEDENVDAKEFYDEFREINDFIIANKDTIISNIDKLNDRLSPIGCSVDYILNWQLESFDEEEACLPLYMPGDELRGADSSGSLPALKVSLRSLIGSNSNIKCNIYLGHHYTEEANSSGFPLDAENYYSIDTFKIEDVLRNEILPAIKQITDPNSPWYEDFIEDHGGIYTLQEISFDLNNNEWVGDYPVHKIQKAKIDRVYPPRRH